MFLEQGLRYQINSGGRFFECLQVQHPEAAQAVPRPGELQSSNVQKADA
jgi:hypothetical protein